MEMQLDNRKTIDDFKNKVITFIPELQNILTNNFLTEVENRVRNQKIPSLAVALFEIVKDKDPVLAGKIAPKMAVLFAEEMVNNSTKVLSSTSYEAKIGDKKINLTVEERPIMAGSIPEKYHISARKNGAPFVALEYGIEKDNKKSSSVLVLDAANTVKFDPQKNSVLIGQEKDGKFSLYVRIDLNSMKIYKGSEELASLHFLKDKITSIKILKAQEVYDCQTFVNTNLENAGLKPLSGYIDKEVSNALTYKRGFIIDRQDISSSQQVGKKIKVDTNKLSDKVKNLPPGSPIAFLDIIPPEAVQDEKESNRYPIVYNGKYYIVRHVAIYGGIENGEPIVYQAHIGKGTFSKMSLSEYLNTSGIGFDAFAIMSPRLSQPPVMANVK